MQLASQLQAQAYNPMDQWVLKLKDAAVSYILPIVLYRFALQ